MHTCQSTMEEYGTNKYSLIKKWEFPQGMVHCPLKILPFLSEKADNPPNNLNTNLRRNVINLLPDQAFE
jgi:hypothetical protein